MDPAKRNLPPVSTRDPGQLPETVAGKASPVCALTLDRFTLIRAIGHGGMGDVFLATHPITGLPVAIKRLKPSLVPDRQQVQRFLTEARHMYHLNHPHILRIMEVWDPPVGPYYVMPYMERGSLAKQIRAGQPLDYVFTLRVARDMAKALAYAHSKGIIHRDLKPLNVLLDAEGRAFLSDFGLVRAFNTHDPHLDVQRTAAEGTAPYMSPAVARGEAEDTRCDIYSFGAMLYELLTGFIPYSGSSSREVLKKILAGPPEPILKLNPHAPPGLVRVAEGAMARGLRDRYSSMIDVLEDLGREVRGKPPLGPHGHEGRKPPLKWLTAAAFLILVVVAGWWAATRLHLRHLPGGAMDTSSKQAAALGPGVLPPTDATGFTNSIGMKFVRIGPGTFMMGSPAGEPGRKDDETLHKVTLSRPFYMAATHVTRGQFAAFVVESGYKTESNAHGKPMWEAANFKQTDVHPVVHVTWIDAMAFCKWLSDKEHKRYRLPTEAEWEYACRGGTQTAFFWGDNPNGGDGYANCADLTLKENLTPQIDEFFNWHDGYVNTSPVGSFKPNPLGLYDMIGNAEQWCSDYYGEYPKDASIDPAGAAVGDKDAHRVVRGGSWHTQPAGCRAAYRGRFGPERHNHNVGFRVCLDITPAATEASPRADVAQPQTAPPSNVANFTNTLKMQFVRIEPGTFMMGSPANEPGREPNHGDDETLHKVTLTHPFYMATTHVTHGQFSVFVVESGYKAGAGADGKVFWENTAFRQTNEHPVVNVTWNDAVAFCKWLSDKEHKRYRLPTEAEWEYACRAGTQTAYFWGDNPDGGQGYANCSDLTRKEQLKDPKPPPDEFFNWHDGFVNTSPVGSFKPNKLGLYDMSGNASQWCNDYFGKYPNDSVDPTGPSGGALRVRRGGSWFAKPQFCRSAFRYKSAPDHHDNHCGFRLCLDPW